MKHILPYLIILVLGLSACHNDPITPALNNPDALFQPIPSDQSNIDFSNTLVATETENLLQYRYFYNGGGVATGDLNNDGLPDIYFAANQNEDQLYLNKGDFKFEEITKSAGINNRNQWSTGVTMADVNGDGWLDIFVCQIGNHKFMKGENKLFINNALANESPTFTDQTSAYGLDFSGFATQSAFFDYDQDGDLDMYLLCHSVHDMKHYKKGDIRMTSDSRAGDKLYRNDGNKFIEVTKEAGIYNSKIGYGLGLSISDINKDGCPDIYVGNDLHEIDYCYLNNCDGTFREISKSSFGHQGQNSVGNEIVDINNDGLPDIITLDKKPEDEFTKRKSEGADAYNVFEFKRKYGYGFQYPRNMLHVNQGNLTNNTPFFSDLAQLAGIDATDWSWSTLIADYNLDGQKDIFISNGIVNRPNDLDYLKYISNKAVKSSPTDLELIAQMPSGAAANYFYKNNGNLTFENVSCDWSNCNKGFTTGAAYADFDNDGDLDLVLNNINEKATILKNTTKGNHLKIVLKGAGKNINGVGASVTLFQNGQTQYLEFNPTRGLMSCSNTDLIFGIEDNEIDSLVVKWTSGKESILRNVLPNQTVTILEEKGNVALIQPNSNNQKQFETITNSGIDFHHFENRYFDLEKEKLIPYLLSSQGPALAIGDLNGDKLMDIFIGNSKQKNGAVFTQSQNGQFKRNDGMMAYHDLFEDVAAAIFDVNNDNRNDCVIISGGNEKAIGQFTEDRLYLNIGNQIKRSPFQLGVNQGSVIAPCDFDKDGDIDYFLGVGNEWMNYGASPTSKLFENNGKGEFVPKIGSLPKEGKLGMITDAKWSDLDGNGFKDLIIVGHWMPITILYNSENSSSLVEIPNTKGLWNCIELADIDKDGDVDLIAGNLGRNHEFDINPNNPLSLYLNDFDDDSRIDPIITYNNGTTAALLATKDELVKQMNSFKNDFQSYEAFASASLDDIFSKEKLESATIHKVIQAESSLFENRDGTFIGHALPMQVNFTTQQDVIAKDLDGDGHIDLLFGGNFYDFIPTIGKMDASYGVYLKGDSSFKFEFIPNVKSGLMINGQVRNMEYLELVNGDQIIVVAKNNAKVQVIKIN